MKNRIKLLVFICLSAAIIACTKIAYPSAEVNYLTGDEQTVTVRSIGLGKDEEKATVNAEQKVFDVLFFRGLPESKQKLPLVGSNETAEKSKNKNYFDSFYSERRHKTFVMSSVPVTNLTKVINGNKMITLDVKVNLNALRHDLETFNVIRKFGY